MSIFAAIGGINTGCPAEKCIDGGRIRIARFPRACYDMFLERDPDMRERWVKRLDDDMMTKMISYSRDKELKKMIYESMRERVISNRHFPHSAIVKEISALCGLVSGIVDYVKITWKMNKDI